MAYSTAAMLPLAPSRDGVTPSIWSYSSTDNLDTILASGYVADAVSKGLGVGDWVLFQESDNTYSPKFLTVASISSGAATLSSGETLATEAGAGIDGIAEQYATSVTRDGSIISTKILIDLTGLNCGGTAGDIIGDDGTGAAHLGQITAAVNGTILGGRMICLEAPATGDADIDLYAADEATGVEDTAIGDLTETQIVNGGAQSLGTTGYFAAMPGASQYLYLVGQGTGNATYTAGRILIEMWGV